MPEDPAQDPELEQFEMILMEIDGKVHRRDYVGACKYFNQKVIPLAPTKHMKSILTMNLSCCLANGIPSLVFRMLEKCKVLFISKEDGDFLLQVRINLLLHNEEG